MDTMSTPTNKTTTENSNGKNLNPPATLTEMTDVDTSSPEPGNTLIKMSDVDTIVSAILTRMAKGQSMKDPTDQAVIALHSADLSAAEMKAIGVGVIKGLARAYGRQRAENAGWLKSKTGR